ncbi:MAG TPA: NAD(P)-dependent oxidoreductase, partial [Acidimicrobiales bacterium]
MASPDPAPRLGITVYGCELDEAAAFHELSPRYGIVPTIVRAAVSEANVSSAAGNRAISVGHKSEISRPLLRALKDSGVDYLSTRSIGLDHIDLDTARRIGITVENVVYAPDGVADYTLMLILMAIRNAKDVLDSAEQHDFRLRSTRGKDLRDLTVGVVGVGRIGNAVVRRLAGFGCRVLACDISPRPAAAAGLISLDDLLFQSDVVTLHLPLNPETHHVIGPAELATMKPGAFLVNTGRGALVDTGALVVALENGRLGGAALDVLEGEEGIFYFDHRTTPPAHEFLLRLQHLPNVIVTPHTAHHTERTLRDTVERTLTNYVDFERNR